MILFFDGAPKHGSHFQMFITTEGMMRKKMNYTQVGNDIFHRRDLRQSKTLLDGLEAQAQKVFVCKGHYGSKKERDLLLSYNTIKIFLIWRDIRDVLVSQYFYDINKGGQTYKDFPDFYWKRGRWFLCYHMAYRRNWDEVSHDPRVCYSNFTDLKTDFNDSAGKLLVFTGIDGVDLESLEKQLSLDQMRVKHNDPNKAFFRKGSVGEHREVIDADEIYEDMDAIEKLGAFHLKVLTYKTRVPMVFHKIKDTLFQH